MYDPWLNERQPPSDRVEWEAAQAAIRAASTLGPDQVSQRLAEARALGDRQAIEAAQRLEGEAQYVQQQAYLHAAGPHGSHSSVVEGISTHSRDARPLTPQEETPEQKAARESAALERQRIQAEREEAQRIFRMRTLQKKALHIERDLKAGQVTVQDVLESALLYLVTAIIAYVGIGLSVLAVSGSWSGEFSWMWMCALGAALAVPILPIISDMYAFPPYIALVPIVASAGHYREDFSFWGIIPLLTAAGVISMIVFYLNLFACEMVRGNFRKDKKLLSRNLPCDYCGQSSTKVKRIPSRFGNDNITVMACKDHEHSTLWTEELEVALLDAICPQKGP